MTGAMFGAPVFPAMSEGRRRPLVPSALPMARKGGVMSKQVVDLAATLEIRCPLAGALKPFR
jgi:hypothetical protein